MVIYDVILTSENDQNMSSCILAQGEGVLKYKMNVMLETIIQMALNMAKWGLNMNFREKVGS